MGQVVLYGGESEEGDLGDIWQLESSKLQWCRAPEGLSQSHQCKVWHAAVVVTRPDVRPPLWPLSPCSLFHIYAWSLSWVGEVHSLHCRAPNATCSSM